MPRPFRISVSSSNRQMGWGEMNVRNARCASMMTCALVSAGAGFVASHAAAQEAYELPPVVVEGATLEAKPGTLTKKPKASSTEDGPSARASSEASDNTPGGTGEIVGADDGAPSPQAASMSDGDTLAGISTRKLGMPVSVVTGAQLKAQQIRNAADALCAACRVSP